jgi:single-stranded-DNA-specific exonuclease
MFNAADVDELMDYDGAADVVFEPKVETWQGRVSCKLHVRDVLRRTAADADEVDAAAAALVDGLFERADEFLNGGELQGLAQASRFHTKVVGVTFDGRQDLVATLGCGDALRVEREPRNTHDPNAVAVLTADGRRLGYLKRLVAAALAPQMDRGAAYTACVENVTGSPDDEGRSLGVNILVALQSEPSSTEELDLLRERAQERARLAGLGTDELTDELKRLLIGEHDLLPAQRRALANLDAGVNTLCVMATGRGKSLIFHVHAARMALVHRRASVFVYPLRALVSDQAFHLGQVFDRLGMVTRVLTGETPLDDRAAVFSGLAEGSVDIVLTTPEFLAIHADRFAQGGRVGFVVVDEAHHAGQAQGGARPAYLEMPRVLQTLGGPTVLAVTATASTPVGSEICRLLGVDPARGLVLDPSMRANLHVVDERGSAGRDDRLVSLLASGQKTLVYVNSREQTVALARMLRRRAADYGRRVAFYNGGLPRRDRAAVEEAFRAGDVRMVVSTSAFGEGVNLPDVRHVVLYHLPFDEVEFNQMSGRAGRDGADAWIHLAFGGHDARINERILASDAPPRNDLVTLYRVLCARDRAARLEGEPGFCATNAELAVACAQLAAGCGLTDKGVSCGIAIFRELGFVRTSGYGASRRVEIVPSPEHMDLARSIRYLEGLRAVEEFERYRDWALSSGASDVLERVCRPIVPDLQV